MTALDAARNAHELGPDTYRAEGWHALVGRLLDELEGPTQERDGRLLQIFLSGYSAGTAGEAHRNGAPIPLAQHYGRHLAEHINADPIAKAQILEGLVPLWQTGDVPPDAPQTIAVHNGHEGGR